MRTAGHMQCCRSRGCLLAHRVCNSSRDIAYRCRWPIHCTPNCLKSWSQLLTSIHQFCSGSRRMAILAHSSRRQGVVQIPIPAGSRCCSTLGAAQVCPPIPQAPSRCALIIVVRSAACTSKCCRHCRHLASVQLVPVEQPGTVTVAELSAVTAAELLATRFASPSSTGIAQLAAMFLDPASSDQVLIPHSRCHNDGHATI